MKKTKVNRLPRLIEENLYLVPLGRKAKTAAIIYCEDYELLMSLGLSPHWNDARNGYVSAPCTKSPTKIVNVARVIMDAGPDQNVTFLDGKKHNLRRENLELVSGWAETRDRDYLEPPIKSKEMEVA